MDQSVNRSSLYNSTTTVTTTTEMIAVFPHLLGSDTECYRIRMVKVDFVVFLDNRN